MTHVRKQVHFHKTNTIRTDHHTTRSSLKYVQFKISSANMVFEYKERVKTIFAMITGIL